MGHAVIERPGIHNRQTGNITPSHRTMLPPPSTRRLANTHKQTHNSHRPGQKPPTWDFAFRKLWIRKISLASPATCLAALQGKQATLLISRAGRVSVCSYHIHVHCVRRNNFADNVMCEEKTVLRSTPSVSWLKSEDSLCQTYALFLRSFTSVLKVIIFHISDI